MWNRRAISLACFVAFVSLAPSSSLDAESKGRVLLIAREKSTSMEFFLDYEVKPIIGLIEKGGYDVVVVDETGGSIKAGKMELAVDKRLSEIDFADYAAIVIPCMGAGDFPVSEGLIRYVNAANAKGMLIAMQHSQEITSQSDLRDREIARRPGVVVSGNLITSYNCPFMAGDNGRPIDNGKLIEALLKQMRDGK
jgi:hypothetical protein